MWSSDALVVAPRGETWFSMESSDAWPNRAMSRATPKPVARSPCKREEKPLQTDNLILHFPFSYCCQNLLLETWFIIKVATIKLFKSISNTRQPQIWRFIREKACVRTAVYELNHKTMTENQETTCRKVIKPFYFKGRPVTASKVSWSCFVQTQWEVSQWLRKHRTESSSSSLSVARKSDNCMHIPNRKNLTAFTGNHFISVLHVRFYALQNTL